MVTVQGFGSDQTLNTCNMNGLVTAGDSLNYNLAVPALATLQPVDLFETEIGGSDCIDVGTNYDTWGWQGYDSRRTRNVYTLGCGLISHIRGYTVAQTYAQILAVLAKAVATGYNYRQVWTLTSAENMLYSWQTDLNTLIRDGAVANNYTVLDVAANANLGCDGCWADTDYFTDRTHYTALGLAIKAGYLTTGLTGLGFPIL